MSDIVERLRADTLPGDRQHQREARIELASLREEAAAEIERLREALDSITKVPRSEAAYAIIQVFARAALPKGENDV